jgi:hypothetical protein
MSEIVFIIPVRNIEMLHRTLSMLSFQKGGGVSAVVVDFAGSDAVSAMVADFEHQLPVTIRKTALEGQPLWKCCLDSAPDAEWVCFVTPGVDLMEKSVMRMRRCIDSHPSFDAFRWNLAEPARKWGLKTTPERLFLRVFEEGDEAPLSSFVFRAKTLRDAFSVDSEAAGMALAIILTAARNTGIRTVRWERVGYNAPAPSADPAMVEKEVRSRLAFFRWSERFFGEEYPLGTGDRLDLFARELARLYPSFTPDELKEDLNTFAVVNGPIRRMRAASALKVALKARQESLK